MIFTKYVWNGSQKGRDTKYGIQCSFTKGEMMSNCKMKSLVTMTSLDKRVDFWLARFF